MVKGYYSIKIYDVYKMESRMADNTLIGAIAIIWPAAFTEDVLVEEEVVFNDVVDAEVVVWVFEIVDCGKLSVRRTTAEVPNVGCGEFILL